MDYNSIARALLLLIRNKDGENVPFASLMPSYGPFNTMEEAKSDLINTFGYIENVPRGYTFCIIEENKPQEYWFTKDGDWASVEKKNISSSTTTTVVSGILFQVKGDYVQVSYDNGLTWNNLIPLSLITGPKGDTGEPGGSGKDGPAGRDADLTKLKLRIVTTTDYDDEENLIYVNQLQISYTGGEPYYPVGNIIGGSGSGGGGGQTVCIETYDDDGYQYWSYGDHNWILDDNGNMVRANGIDGSDGRDGRDGDGSFATFKSIVFKRTNNDISSQRPTGGSFNRPIPTDPQGWFDGVPSGEEKLWMSTKWFYTIESMNEDDVNPWSLPGPATDTADIDFEYSNAPLDIDLGVLRNPSVNRYSVGNPNGWYDPIEHNELMEDANWMAMRKKKNGEWETEPASTNGWIIWKCRGEGGTPGVSPTAHFKSFAFRRSNNYTTSTVGNKTIYTLNPAENPSGGNYSNPNPTNTDPITGDLLWSDGIPQTSQAKLWESTCIFHSDGTSEGWTTPAPVGDTDYMDYEYATENPAYPKPQRRSPNDLAPDYPSGRENDGWDDEPDYTKDYVWRAERPVQNGQYVPGSDWLVIRIKGERGTDGTSVTIVGTLAAIYDTWDRAQADRSNRSDGDLIYVSNDDPSTGGTNEVGVYQYDAANNRYTKLSPSEGDGYMYGGDLWVWDGDSLVNVGPIQGPAGPPGTSYYLHIKYSDDGGNTFTANYGETPGKYIGTYTNTFESKYAEDTMDITKYKWQEWVGQDGFGYEYIFTLTSKDDVNPTTGNPNPPVVPINNTSDPLYSYDPTSDYQQDDFVPDAAHGYTVRDWTDDPQSPSKAYPYCWVAYRKKVDGVWTVFKGNSTNNTKAALFGMYSSRGRGIADITEMYAVATFGDQATYEAMSASQKRAFLNTFSTSQPSFDPDHGYKYLWNYETVSYDDDSEDTSTDPICIGAYIPGKGLGKIVEYYYASQYGPDENGDPSNSNAYPLPANELPSSSWSKKPLRVDKDKPFLWNYEVVWFDDNTVCNVTVPACIAYYTYTDVEYLLTIFKKVEGDSNTAYLGGLIGVVEDDAEENPVVRAALNATENGYSEEHGKMFIASGMRGVQNMDNATFKVYEDGHVEMHDALIQAFLQQYYKNQGAITDPTSTYGGANNMEIIPSKCSNYVMLGWEGLAVTNNKYYLNLNTYGSGVNELSTGKIIFTNSIYIADDGVSYYNINNNQTVIAANFILPDGTLRKAGLVVLKNGWVEIGKVRILTANNTERVPTLTDLQNVYMIYSWGGNVCFKLGNSSMPVVNGVTSAITSYQQNLDYSVSRFIASDDFAAKIYPQNQSIYINGDGTEGTLFVVMPIFRQLVGALGAVDCPTPISWIFELNASHRQVIFKVEDLRSHASDPNVPSLENLRVKYGGSTVDFSISNTQGSGGNRQVLIKLTYYPFMGVGDLGEWIAESISPIGSL